MVERWPSGSATAVFPDPRGALVVPGIIGAVPTAGAAARTTLQVMGSREHHEAIFQIPVGLR